MSKRAVLAIALVTPVLMFAVPHAAGAAEEEVESPFLLQEHGSVRILRGLNPDQNFQAATLPKDLDVAPAAAPPEAPPQIDPPQIDPPQIDPRRTGLLPERKTTRQLALERIRDRGITVNRAGVRRAIERDIETTRQRALERRRERGIALNPAGG